MLFRLCAAQVFSLDLQHVGSVSVKVTATDVQANDNYIVVVSQRAIDLYSQRDWTAPIMSIDDNTLELPARRPKSYWPARGSSSYATCRQCGCY